MKIKQRALALILSAIMVLTFMPALVFAEPSGNWTLTQNDNEFRLFDEEDSVELTAWIENYDEDTAFEYRWLKDEVVYEDWQDYDGDVIQIDAEETGQYVLEARETQNTGSCDEVTFNVRTWRIPDNEDDEETGYFLPKGNSVSLDATVDADYAGNFTYQWQKENRATLEYEDITGATQPAFTATTKGSYRCKVTETIDGTSWERTYDAYVYNYDDPEWYVDYDEDVILENGVANLAVEIEEDGFAGSYSFSWTKWDDDEEKYIPVTGANGKSITVTEPGEYRCYIKESTYGDEYNAHFYVDTWGVRAKEESVDIFLNSTATLEVEILGEAPEEELTYAWYFSSIDEFDEDAIPIEGEETNKLVVDMGGYYQCRVYYGSGEDYYDYKEVYFTADELEKTWKADSKEYRVELKAGKTALLETVVTGTYDDLSYQWYKEEWSEEDEPDRVQIQGATEASYEAKESGDYVCVVTNTNDEGSETEDVEFWVYNEEIVENGLCYYLVDNNSVAVNNQGSLKGAVTVKPSVKFSNGKAYPVTIISDFRSCSGMTSINLPSTITSISSEAFLNTGLKSISIPASVNYIGEHALGYTYTLEEFDTGEKDGDGDPIYGYRDKYTPVPGFVIFGKTGSAAQTYAKANGITFRDPAAEQAAAAKAKADAEAKAREAIRQGTPDGSLPKVKLNKPAAKKTSITVKWKKLTKKQLKKSKATHYEIWVSESSTYPAGATTKETIVKKGKSKWTCKGLTKNKKYFVRIRAIKYVGGVKHVGPWKQRTIKTKKK